VLNNLSILSVFDLESLAQLLKTQPRKLAYIIYKIKDEDRYAQFEIPKKRGGTRTITAPNKGLKTIQSRLAKEFLKVYPERHCVHGFTKGKSIRSNASLHLHKRWIVNIDLKDFFPSIHFGRIHGLLMAKPFCLGERIAREIANLCCYRNALPQGAPTSPILSNFACWQLDNQLYRLAKACRCTYSRYADDITFSTNLQELPSEIGTIVDKRLVLSPALIDIIQNNSFEINLEKVRYAQKYNHQEVTGVVVNSSKTNVRRTYVRQVRAMLHACEHFGLESAAKEHYSKYHPDKNPANPVKSFMYELKGKIGYIRFIKRYRATNGKTYDSKVYAKLKDRLLKLYPEASLSATKLYLSESERPIVLGEGITDWKYMKKALDLFQAADKYNDLDLVFREYEESEGMGWSKLLNFCTSNMEPFPHKVICVFDRDEDKILNQADSPKPFKFWGNNVYSIILPTPKGRLDRFCIEQYFTDEEIMTEDENGHRLYLSSEFDKDTGKHISMPDVHYAKKSPTGSFNYLKKTFTLVLPDSVWNAEGKNIALPKRDFANYIYSGKPGFDKFNFDNFQALFDVIREILAE
jgi:RNA-directed DNA polymerase